MADYNKNARSVINNFLWKEITDAGILNHSDYRPDGSTTTLVPIIPSQQTPEFNNLIEDKTYIIYDYEVEGYSDDWWVCHETMLYTIVSTEYSKIVQIMEFMIDLFRRVDLSGLEIQEFNTESNLIKFYSSSIESASSPIPVESEGGRTSGMIQISYQYSRIVGDNGRFV